MLEKISNVRKYEEGFDMEVVLTFIMEIPNMDFDEYAEQLDISVVLLYEFMNEVHKSKEGPLIIRDSRCKGRCLECIFDTHLNFKFRLDPKFDIERFIKIFNEGK